MLGLGKGLGAHGASSRFSWSGCSVPRFSFPRRSQSRFSVSGGRRRSESSLSLAIGLGGLRNQKSLPTVFCGGPSIRASRRRRVAHIMVAAMIPTPRMAIPPKAASPAKAFRFFSKFRRSSSAVWMGSLVSVERMVMSSSRVVSTSGCVVCCCVVCCCADGTGSSRETAGVSCPMRIRGMKNHPAQQAPVLKQLFPVRRTKPRDCFTRVPRERLNRFRPAARTEPCPDQKWFWGEQS